MNDKHSAPGRLILMPNTLDLGCVPDGQPQPDVRDVVPLGVLQQAAGLQHWVAENAKTTRAFLKRVDAVVPLAQPLQQVQIEVLPRPPKGGSRAGVPDAEWNRLLAPALQGHDLGLISEAGLPAVADPGAGLVAAAHRRGVPVLALSGPSSLMLALAGSGLHGQSFAFHGYLPTDAAERLQKIRQLENASRQMQQTQMAIETPYRNAALLQALTQGLQPSTRLCVAFGVTLAEGRTLTRTVSDWQRGGQALLQSLPMGLPAVFAWLAD